jgi:hypothetical protein
MEVHHHPHAEKKSFKEYILEFVMIFLAVTLGFFAESYREHIVDKDRIHDYMKELVQNLQYDSASCLHNYQGNLVFEKGMDSLRRTIDTGINGHLNSNALYYYSFQYFGNFSQASFNNSAITELKSSGSFRLIANKQLTAEIYDYYERKVRATDDYLPSREQTDETTRIANEFFSLRPVHNFVESFDSMTSKTYTGNYDYRELLRHDPPLTLLKKDPADLDRLYTAVEEFEIKLKAYNFWLVYCRDSAKKLISDISEEYHFENK